jgi:hypothetical protein
MKNSPLFIEYQEIRRRIEHRLARMQAVMGHILVNFAAMIAIFIYYDNSSVFQVDRRLTAFMMLWSQFLLLHSLWVYRKSAASNKARDAAITHQLDERIERDDTEILNNPREAFRLHGLLEEDIRKRSGMFLPALLFVGLNAMMWMMAMSFRSTTFYPGEVIIPMFFMFLIPAVIINMFRRGSRERKYNRLFTNWSALFQESNPYPKPKHGQQARTLHLGDDGELVEGYLTESKVIIQK